MIWRLRYLWYIIQHKFYVAIESLKMFMPLHAITHDLSKFLPSEFFPYAMKFFSGDYAYKYFEVEERFAVAWFKHQRRNKHHWDYWVMSNGNPIPMPTRYVKQMVCDWRAMARKFGDTAEEYYKKKKERIVLHSETVKVLEKLLYPLLSGRYPV